MFSDLALVWLQLFQQLSLYGSLQQQTHCLKDSVSLLLGGLQVIHLESFGPVQPIFEHCGDLSLFHKTLMSHPLYLHPRSLQGLSALLDRYVGARPPEDEALLCFLT